MTVAEVACPQLAFFLATKSVQLQHQYLIVDDVLQEMYEQFQEYQFLKLESCDLRFLPDAVRWRIPIVDLRPTSSSLWFR